MKTITTLVFFFSFALTPSVLFSQTTVQKEIGHRLDQWHQAAAEAKYTPYFEMMTDDAIFIGTDATENWNKTAFQAFAKPYFDRGKAWHFTPIERHIFVDSKGKTAWFDELLSTQMKICRGSGVLKKVGNQWKIQHYVLSMTIPNDNVNEVVKIKTPLENALLEKWGLKE